MPDEAGRRHAETGGPGLGAGAGAGQQGTHRIAGAPQGLAWSWEIDLQELLAAVTGQDGHDSEGGPEPDETGRLAGGHEDQDAVLEAEQEALEACPAPALSPGELAGLTAGRMTPGPGLAALLAAASPAELTDYGLPDAAAAWRRVSSWAQARELACVAEIAARAAAGDPKAGTGADGRPAQVTRQACAQVSLALTLTGASAEWWTDLAVTLGWQLRATGAALAAGVIDLARARLIAEATCLLDDQAARAVEDKILPGAGEQTTGALRAALRRAVIAADPAGAERRRAEAERRARVVLYPEAESTATLAGQSLPGVHATAAMAKIQAMARALKAAGAPGSHDLLCAQVYLGLLLGTLPPIPPARGAPPDEPPGDQSPGDEPSGDEPADQAPDDEPAPDEPPDDDPADDGKPRRGDPGSGSGRSSRAGPRPGHGGDMPWPDSPAAGHDPDGDTGQRRDEPGPGKPSPPEGSDQDDDWAAAGTEPAWPDLPASIPPGLAAPGTARPGQARPARGLLDLAVPWRTLAGLSPEPGWLGRLGPVTPIQARRLADLAARDPATPWRILLISPSGQARAIASIPRPRDGPRQPADSHDSSARLVSRVTLTIPDTIPDRAPPDPLNQRDPLDPPDPPNQPYRRDPADPADPAGSLGQILAAALRAASRAAARADADRAADILAGGCAHQGATAAYRPPPSLRDHVAARDLTCRYPTCRQPAQRGDLDHTLPWARGGKTCRCNLGGVCRTHHQIKQHPSWTLRQDTPGVFTWTTPAGHSYTVHPA